MALPDANLFWSLDPRSSVISNCKREYNYHPPALSYAAAYTH